ncbi:sodium/potassium-transporting ATPase subunit beta-2-like [Bacillus rossius redtenbacheri]|uniref:sodium/potassium-transporting ATPase subunit beta-2-like n=1 Tax=Bacillus rossius redtenbacheri TaxID=93214 RepID=UPI002FDD414D
MENTENSTNKTSYAFPPEKPEPIGKWAKIRRAIWNPESKQFLGRTGKSWAGILFFYVCFYSALAALFAICMQVLLLTVNDEQPRWTLDNSLIGTSPGLGFRPITKDVEHGGSLIWYDGKNESQIKIWKDRLDEFLEMYLDKNKLPGKGQNQVSCNFTRPPIGKQVCEVPVNKWGECSSSNGYSYHKNAPCIFIKLNRIFGWVPEYYNDPESLPEDMPDSLKEAINRTDPKERNMVWVSCQGENPADRENSGTFSYHPMQGFPSFYYPYTFQEDYLSPLVAVRLERPALNVLINIECRAWAKNINYVRNANQREGSVHFEVMID